MLDSAFQPAALSIAAGTTVTWGSSGATPHTSTSDDALWDSGQLAPQPFARTFTTPGTYTYHCTFHLQTMRGIITVVAPRYLPIVLNPDTAAEPSPTTTVQPSATATVRPSPTATVQPSPTATTGPPPVRGIRGNVQVRPRWAVIESQPTEYTRTEAGRSLDHALGCRGGKCRHYRHGRCRVGAVAAL